MISSRVFGATGTVTALSTVALLALTGCESVLAQSRLDYSNTEEVKITQITMTIGDPDNLNQRPGEGDVSVRTAKVSNVQIKRVLRYRGAEPTANTYRIDGTQLFVDTDCGRQCSVSYEILAPQGVAVRGELETGDVSLSGVSAVDIKVDTGDISVNDASGEVIAETGTGDVTLVLDEAAPVKAHTDTGSIDATVPAGIYRIWASTEAGSKRVDVADDPKSTTLLDLSTDTGDIEVHQA